MELDAIDLRILAILQNNGRITNAQLAKDVGLSPPAALSRVRRLEGAGIIRKYVALLDRQKLGYDLLAIVAVSISHHRVASMEQIREKLIAFDQVMECFQTAGDVDFLMKVVCEDMERFTTFMNNELSSLPGIQNIQTSIVIDTLKSATSLKVEHPGAC